MSNTELAKGRLIDAINFELERVNDSIDGAKLLDDVEAHIQKMRRWFPK